MASSTDFASQSQENTEQLYSSLPNLVRNVKESQ